MAIMRNMSPLQPRVIIIFVIMMFSMYLILNNVLSTTVTISTESHSSSTAQTNTRSTDNPITIEPDTLPSSNDDEQTNTNVPERANYELYLESHPELEARFNAIGGDHILHSNPMHDDQCRNAILYKEDIDPISLLNKPCTRYVHVPKVAMRSIGIALRSRVI